MFALPSSFSCLFLPLPRKRSLRYAGPREIYRVFEEKFEFRDEFRVSISIINEKNVRGWARVAPLEWSKRRETWNEKKYVLNCSYFEHTLYIFLLEYIQRSIYPASLVRFSQGTRASFPPFYSALDSFREELRGVFRVRVERNAKGGFWSVTTSVIDSAVPRMLGMETMAGTRQWKRTNGLGNWLFSGTVAGRW